MRLTTKSFTFSVFILLFSAFSNAHSDSKSDTKQGDFVGLDTAAGKTVLAFRHALQNGDESGVLAHLADDVLIFEGKRTERSAKEYAAHHMLSDMRFLSAVSITSLEHHVRQYDKTAVSTSRSLTTGEYKGKSIDREGNETLTLELGKDGWKITHIHWSH